MFAKEYLTLREAGLLWNKDPSSLRNAIRSGKFTENELGKPGRDWLIKRSAMQRVFGKSVRAEIGNFARGLFGLRRLEEPKTLNECFEIFRLFGFTNPDLRLDGSIFPNANRLVQLNNDIFEKGIFRTI